MLASASLLYFKQEVTSFKFAQTTPICSSNDIAFFRLHSKLGLDSPHNPLRQELDPHSLDSGSQDDLGHKLEGRCSEEDKSPGWSP